MHPFDAAVELMPLGDGVWLGQTSPAYGNMVGPFGGVTAAQALSGVLRHPQRLGEPVALTVNFAAALNDGAFTVHSGISLREIRELREGIAMLRWTRFTAFALASYIAQYCGIVPVQ